VFVKVGEEFG